MIYIKVGEERKKERKEKKKEKKERKKERKKGRNNLLDKSNNLLLILER